jgi:hypothetical protein
LEVQEPEPIYIAVLLFDLLVQNQLRVTWELICAKRLDVRYTLHWLGLLKTYQEMASRSVAYTPATGYQNDSTVRQLRKLVFSDRGKAVQVLDRLLIEYVQELYRVAFAMDAWLAETIPTSAPNIPDSATYRISFMDVLDPSESIRRTLKTYAERNEIMIYLSHRWREPLAIYAQEGGTAGTHIAASWQLLEPITMRPVGAGLFRQRIGYVNDYFDSITRSGMNIIVIPFYALAVDHRETWSERLFNLWYKANKRIRRP